MIKQNISPAIKQDRSPPMGAFNADGFDGLHNDEELSAKEIALNKTRINNAQDSLGGDSTRLGELSSNLG